MSTASSAVVHFSYKALPPVQSVLRLGFYQDDTLVHLPSIGCTIPMQAGKAITLPEWYRENLGTTVEQTLTDALLQLLVCLHSDQTRCSPFDDCTWAHAANK